MPHITITYKGTLRDLEVYKDKSFFDGSISYIVINKKLPGIVMQRNSQGAWKETHRARCPDELVQVIGSAIDEAGL